MSQERLIVACDFGTTSFRAVICEVDDGGSVTIIGHSEHKCAGFLDGDFIDLKTGSRAIAATVSALEKSTDTFVTGFTYNISGSHLRSVRSMAQVPIGPGPRPIREGDLEEVRQRVRSLAIPFDHKILSVTPVEYVVDRVRGIVDPVGRVGSQLEMHAHLITGSRTVLHNIENAVETSGYQPLGEEVDVLAAAAGLLALPEKEAGVMLIDIGGTATNWVVFAQGTVQANGMVPLGGHHLTQDLAHGLRISCEEAEDAKRERGVVLRSLVDEVPVEVLFEEELPKETPGLLAAILEPRFEEILALVKQDYGDMGQLARLQAGVVLTGGGSRPRGAAQLCEEVFDLPATTRYLPPALAGAESLPQGQWATAIGLSLGAAADAVELDALQAPLGGGGIIHRIRNLFRGGKRNREALSAKA
ncbi:MAG: cell division protein FtsA [bacterium]|nr:cell division protein FtsA [bacterium]